MLSKEHVQHIGRIWVDFINAPYSAEAEQALWADLARAIGEEEMHPLDLRGYVADETSSFAQRGRWYEWFQAASARMAVHALDADTWPGLERALDQGRVGFVFYFRALDRSPGGNSDNRVLKLTLSPQGDLWFQHIHCTDGYFYRSNQIVILPPPQPEAMRSLVAAMRALLADRGAQTREFTIDDPQTDNQEGDGPWSSVEIMMFAPWSEVAPGKGRDAQFMVNPEFHTDGWSLVARVHQRALCRQWRDAERGDRDVVPTPPEGAAKALLDGVYQLTGATTPQAFGWQEDRLAATIEAHTRGYLAFTAPMRPEVGPRILPIYLCGA